MTQEGVERSSRDFLGIVLSTCFFYVSFLNVGDYFLFHVCTEVYMIFRLNVILFNLTCTV